MCIILRMVSILGLISHTYLIKIYIDVYSIFFGKVSKEKNRVVNPRYKKYILTNKYYLERSNVSWIGVPEPL